MNDCVLGAVLERGVVRIGARWDLTFEQFINPETGEPGGVVAEVGQLLAESLGVTPDFVVLEWKDQIPALVAGRVDVLLKHTNLPVRALEVEFSAGVLLEYEGVVLVREADRGNGRSWVESSHLRLAAVLGAMQEAIIRERFVNASFVGVPDNDEGAELVRIGSVDGLVVDAGLFVPDGCAYLEDQTGERFIVSRDASHPCVALGQYRFLRWLDTFMDFHTRLGTIRRIVERAQAEHARLNISKLDRA